MLCTRLGFVIFGPFKKLQPVLAFAAKHLDEDLSLKALAGQAGLSSFHLQRVFASTAGETPKQVTSRLRLERAAALLVSTRDSIIDVALACGFQSHEVFSRSFRRRFKMTPTAYRDRGLTGGRVTDHAALVTQVGPCVGLFHIATNSKPEERAMTYSIAKKQIQPQPVLVVRRRVKPDEMGKVLGEIFGQTSLYAQRSGVAMVGPPFSRYLEWGPGLWTIEAGMPIATADPGDGDVKSEMLPGGFAAVTTHSGPYDQLSLAHAAVQQWIEAEGLVAQGAPWESYVTDPADYPDLKDWKTEIFWPLAS